MADNDPQVVLQAIHQTDLQLGELTGAFRSVVESIDKQSASLEKMASALSTPKPSGISLQNGLVMLAMLATIGWVYFQGAESRIDTGFAAIEEDEQQDRVAMLERVRVNTQEIAELRGSTERHYNASIKTNGQHSAGVKANRDSICDLLHKVDPGAPCRDAVEQSYLP